uniref:maleylacetoacetate isomerase n=1 Tax=Brachionus rotundiformis TaxID=96890 RepID=A0A3G2JSF4_9BILA|nr:glutathione S-transferase Z2 [Brachionus rotundiformis]
MNQIKIAKPILWSYFQSTCSWRVRIALNLKAIDYEYRAVDLLKNKGGEQFSKEFTNLNPKQEVPILFIDNYLFTQSIPIIEYLDETRRHGARLLPDDPVKRAKCRIIAELINSGIQPYQNANVIKKINAEMGKDKRKDWLHFYLNKGLNAVEEILKETKGRYCVGDEITMADLFLVPQVFAAKRYKIDMSIYPLINTINSELENIDDFLRAHPYSQPDFLRI